MVFPIHAPCTFCLRDIPTLRSLGFARCEKKVTVVFSRCIGHHNRYRRSARVFCERQYMMVLATEYKDKLMYPGYMIFAGMFCFCACARQWK